MRPRILAARRISSLGAIPLLLASQGLVNVGLGTFGVLYNLYLAALGQSLPFIGTFNALSILALGLSSVPTGAAARLMSHRQVLALGTILLVAVQAVLAMAAGPSLLLFAGVVWGVAQALCLVPAGPLITESVPRAERAAVFAQLYAVWALATVVGSILGGLLPGLLAALFAIGGPGSTGAYRGALLITNGIALLGLPPLLVRRATARVDEAESQVDAPAGHGWALRTVRRTLAAVVVTMGLYSFAAGIVAPFLNIYFARELHLPTSLIGVLFALAALLSIPGSLAGPRLSRRVGSVRAVVMIRLAIAPCLLALALGNAVPLLAVIGFLVRFALIFTAGALDAHFTLSAVPMRTRPLAAGLRTGTFNLCWALGAWGAGELIERVGYPAMFLTSALLTAVASLLFLVLFGLPA
jgi:predicted MFS family arabinose efflux permease